MNKVSDNIVLNQNNGVGRRFYNAVIGVKAEVFFAFTAALFGLATIFITPPLQGPDEDVHFLICYCYSHGTDAIPQSVSTFAQRQYDLPFKPHVKYSLSRWREEYIKTGQPSQENEPVYHYSFNPFSALSYVSPIAAIRLGSFFTENKLILLLVGRLACLAFFVTMCYWSIRIIPFAKWLMVLFLLMPSVVFGASVISYDSSLISVSMMIIALMGKLINQSLSRPLLWRDMWSFFIWIAILTTQKPPYTLIAVPVLFWPRLRFSMNPYSIKIVMLLIVLGAIFCKTYAQMHYASYASATGAMHERIIGGINIDDKSDGIRFTQRIGDLKTDPVKFATDFSKSLVHTLLLKDNLMLYIGSFIGCLGWLDVLLPPSLLCLYYLCIFTLVCMGCGRRVLTLLDRLSFLIISTAITLFIFAFFYIVDKKSGYSIFGIQGRYFVPCAPLVLLALRNSLLGRKIKHRQFWSAAISMSAATMIMVVMVITLLQRYYFSYWWNR